MASRYDDRGHHSNSRSSHSYSSSKDQWDKQDRHGQDHNRYHDRDRDRGDYADSSARRYRDDRDRYRRSDSRNDHSRSRPSCDWSEHTSSSGKRYFYNCKTEVSQWEKPAELAEFEKRYGTKQEGSSRSKAAEDQSADQAQQNSSHRAKIDEDRSKALGLSHAPAIQHQQSHGSNSSHHRQQSCNNSGSYPNHNNNSQHAASSETSTPGDLAFSSRKRRDEQCSSLQATESSSPKRWRGNEAEQAALKHGEASHNSHNNAVASTSASFDAGASDVDFERLPQLLVQIAERYNIDLTQPDALEKLKHYLKTTIDAENGGQPDEQTNSSFVEQSSQAETMMDVSPGSSVKQENHYGDDEQQPAEDAYEEKPVVTVEEMIPLPPLHQLPYSFQELYSSAQTSHIGDRWLAEHFERQTIALAADSFRRCVEGAQVSADLKCARSLVRTAEIRATLLEQRVTFLRQQTQLLDSLKLPSSVPNS